MKTPIIRFAGLVVALSLVLQACIAKPAACKDPLGCVLIGNKQPIKIAALLTLSGPDSPYGIDALRGIEIAIAQQKELAGHPIELVKVDDLCTEQGGAAGAKQIAADPTIVGVIGATCSSSTVPAARIVSDAGLVIISPSSTAPSLTIPGQYQPGFFRTIYNDRAQGKSVAEFAYRVLGLRTMSTIDDGAPYAKELADSACENFEKLGGACLGRIRIQTGQDVAKQIEWIARLNTEVLYFPVYTTDGINIVNQAAKQGLRSALISSDGLLSTDFIKQTEQLTQGMYISGPAPAAESEDFTKQYVARYGEQPTASYHLQAYDAALMLFAAIQQAAVAASSADASLFVGKQAVRDAIRHVHGVPGLSGMLTCSDYGDCAEPRIEMYQVQKYDFTPIYP